MTSALLAVAVATVGSCWSRPAPVVYCEPVVVYTPCTPVYVPCRPVTHSCQSTPLAPVVAETEEVKAELAEDKPLDPVTEVAKAEETEGAEDESALQNVSDTEAIGFGTPGLDLGHLALDWGVSSIGSGALYPSAPPPISGGGGGGIFGGGGSGSGSDSGARGGATSASGAFPQVINNITIINNNNNSGGGGGDPVPEPLSLAIWGAGLGAIGYRQWRSRRAAAA